MDLSKLPFNELIGLAIDSGAVVLTPGPCHLNHLGTVHAGVLFCVAETASGLCLLQSFPDLQSNYVSVVRSSTVKYRRPADPGSPLVGRGILDAESIADFLERLESRGRATLDVGVKVTQGEATVFTGSFSWLASGK